MVFRQLGRTGLQVSALGLGTVKLGRNRQVKYPSSFELPGDLQVEELLGQALRHGVLLWDTAPAYGLSEERLGPFVQRARDRIVLCSKCGEEFDESGSRFDFSPGHCRLSVERSLKRLRTDHLDVLLLHSDGDDRSVLAHGDTLELLLRLREEGKVTAVGISAKTAESIELAAQSLDVIMAPYGLQHRGLEEPLRQAHEAGCGVLAIKVLDQGHGLKQGEVEEQLASSLRFVLNCGFVDAAIVGTADPRHLKQAAQLAERITAEEG